MSATVRKMEPRDVLPVYELGLQYFDPSSVPYGFWCMTEVAHHLDDEGDLAFVADVDGQVVGFALAAASYGVNDDIAHLAWMALLPEFRRERLAVRLTYAVRDALLAMGKMELVADVSSDNEQTLTILRAVGFEDAASVTYLTRRLDSGHRRGSG